MPGARTFIAVDVTKAVRSRATDLIARLETSDAKVSWVSPKNMHVTLKFLGDQTDDDLVAVCRAVARAAQTVTAFGFRCDGVGAFPGTRRPRTLWVGISEGQEALLELHAAIDAELSGLGIVRDRQKYQPHMTLGRVRGGGPATESLGLLVEKFSRFPGAPVSAREVLVISSQLDRRGAIYDVLARAPLAMP